MAINLQPGKVIDVGDVVGRLTRAYPLAKPPKVSPAALTPLIEYLRTVTLEVRAQYDRTWQWGVRDDNLPSQGAVTLQGIQTELSRWEERMNQYVVDLNICAQQSDDPACTTWTIIAPLFFGYFDGPQGTSPQSRADISTPFIIANQLAELRAWATDSLGWTGGIRDLEDSARNVAGTISSAVDGTMRILGSSIGAAASGVVAGLGSEIVIPLVAVVVLWLLFRKRPNREGDEIA